ncbi:VOC family protein [Enterococcus gilvus]|uniref:VOC family protein n=1 Tax=Enterococcus gilvus TaxID=160453 RepID=UPI003D15FACD
MGRSVSQRITGDDDFIGKSIKTHPKKFVGDQAGGRVFLFLGTDDFQRDYHKMLEKGIVFVRDPKDAAYGTVAVFEDLYGNLWDLIQFSDDHPMKQRMF